MTFRRFLSYIFAGSASRVKFHHRLAQALKTRGRRRLANIVLRRVERRYGVFISVDADVPVSTRFPHPIGIVIGKGVRLGERVTIYQNVTLGGRRLGHGQEGLYPRIGADVVVFAGAVVVGGISIGSNSIIGANSVVITDIPEGSIVVGVPGRILAPTGQPAAVEREAPEERSTE